MTRFFITIEYYGIVIRMDRKQICIASGEANALVIKGFLEAAGIPAAVVSQGNRRLSAGTTFAILVFEDKAEEALALLKEEGILDK